MQYYTKVSGEQQTGDGGNLGPALMRDVSDGSGLHAFEPARLALVGLSLVVLGLLAALLLPATLRAGVLSQSDLQRVGALKPLFANLMSDLSQSARRTDIAAGDTDCINSTIQELAQISDELASYEYLIGMDKDVTGFDDKNPMRDLVKFAAEKSSAILTTERKRLVQISDQCARFPVAAVKTQQTLQVIDTANGTLTAIRDRL